MIKISMLESGHLFNHSDINHLIEKCKAAIGVLIDKTRNCQSNFILTAEDLLGTGKNKFYKTED